ncbi:hypothetical protein EAI_00927 [Harpegnathos saltator]|uniref:Uncharacterized protein n=1 Tax=Harpegnathos saltator TaxID=610380 RepID=E2BSW9_HARSA|nr:hypothetical protein EAI_00927 [Harpegnathos saltator]
MVSRDIIGHTSLYHYSAVIRDFFSQQFAELRGIQSCFRWHDMSSDTSEGSRPILILVILFNRIISNSNQAVIVNPREQSIREFTCNIRLYHILYDYWDLDENMIAVTFVSAASGQIIEVARPIFSLPRLPASSWTNPDIPAKSQLTAN